MYKCFYLKRVLFLPTNDANVVKVLRTVQYQISNIFKRELLQISIAVTSNHPQQTDQIRHLFVITYSMLL
jgi:hypothetical protein